MSGLTTDPTEVCLNEYRPDGMQKCYLILSAEERAKGFVRPVYRSYIHRKCGAETTMALELCETYARDPKFYGATFCVACGDHYLLRNVDGTPAFFWVKDGQNTYLAVGD